MNEHPMIFKGEMVRAILDGRKTQTRRLVKPQPDDEDYGLDTKCQWYAPTIIVNDLEEPGPEVFGFSSEERGWKFPYGSPGDRLWVRETWMPVDLSFREPANYSLKIDNKGKRHAIVYKADADYSCDWRSPIHMFRWASRINLEILNVRVERLQAITHADILAEGIKQTEPDKFYLAPLAGTPDYPWTHSGSAYASLWNSINAKSDMGWDVNPWVWVIEFKRVEQ